MPDPIDPSTLEGGELDRWYRRSPQVIERERRAKEEEQYAAYFDHPNILTHDDAQPEIREQTGTPDGPDDVLWIATGAGGFRAIRPRTPDYEIALGAPPPKPANLTGNPASPEAADLVEIGNPHNPRLRREWEGANGQAWPKTADGRNFHVAHKRAIADGGSNTLDNIEPMHPDEHIAQHVRNGDSARWGRRPWTARAFGGRVLPATPGFRVNGLGGLGLLSDLTGILSGRIRTDTLMHSLYDMAGYAAPDDERRMTQAVCRSMGIYDPNAICM